MYRDTYLPSPKRGKIATSNGYTKISEQKAKEITQIVCDLYSTNGIPVEVTKEETCERVPEASVTVSPVGLTLRLGINLKKTTVTKVTPKGGW